MAHPIRNRVRWVQNAFTGAALDRVGDSRRRDLDWLAAQLEHPGARAVVAGDRGLRIADNRLELVPLAELDGGRAAPARPRRRRAGVRLRRGPAARRARADGRQRRRARRAAEGRLRRPHPVAPGRGAVLTRGRRARGVHRGAAELASPPPLLLRLRARERRHRGRPHAALPELRLRASPAHRPGRDHARRGRRPAPARPPGRLADRPLLRAGGVRGAGRVARGGRRARGARGVRRARRAGSTTSPRSPGRSPRA